MLVSRRNRACDGPQPASAAAAAGPRRRVPRPRRCIEDHVFGHGILDTLGLDDHDAFWMLPFSSRKQADLIRQETNIPDDDRQRRRAQLPAEHKHAGARTQLIQGWKQWIGQESFAERSAKAMAHAPAATPGDFPEYDSDD